MKKKNLKTLLAIFSAISVMPLAACGTKKDTPKIENVDLLSSRGIYYLASINGFVGTYEDWLQSLDAQEVLIEYDNGQIKWKYADENDYKIIFNVNSLTGNSGESAYDIYKKYHENYEGSESDFYQDLIYGSLETVKNSDPSVNKTTLEYKLSSDGSYYIVTGIGDTLEDVNIVIPSTYNNKPVKEINEYAFFYRNDIKSIDIPDSVTVVGKGAFMGCSNLKEIKFKNADFKDDAFYNCTSLRKITFNDRVDKWFNLNFESEKSNPLCYANDGKAEVYMYNYNNELFNYNQGIVLDIPNTVTEIKDYALLNFDLLKNVVIPDSVEKIAKGSLKGCSRLEAITIPFVGDGSNKTEDSVFGYIFGDEGFDNSVNHTFKYNKDDDDLVDYAIPANLASVTILEGGKANYGSFYMMDSLIKVDIQCSDIDDYAFYNCSSIKKITMADDLTSIGSYAFSGVQMEELEFSSSLKYIGDYVFEGMSELEELIIPEGVEYIGKYAFKGLTNCKKIVIPSTVKAIDYGAFAGASSLEEIEMATIGCGLEADYNNYSSDSYDATKYLFGFIFGSELYDNSYKVNDLYYAPQSLKKITITSNMEIAPYFFEGINVDKLIIADDSNMTSLGANALAGATIKELSINSVTSLDITAINTVSGLTKLFANGLTTFTSSLVNDSKTSLLELCLGSITKTTSDTVSGMTNLTLFDAKNVVFVGANSFKEMTNLKNVYISEDLTKVGDYAFYNVKLNNKLVLDNVTSVGMYAFNGFIFDYKVNLSNVETLGIYAFSNAEFSYDISLDSLGEIGSHAFYCAQLKGVNLNDNITNIGQYAFSYANIGSIDLSKITNISQNAFTNATIGCDVDLSSLTTMGTSAFANTNIINVTLNPNLKSLPQSAFNGSTVENIDLSNLTSIGTYAFKGSKIKNVNLNDSLTALGTDAFINVSTIVNVYTGGLSPVKTDDFGTLESIKTFTVSDNCLDVVLGDNFLKNAKNLENPNYGGFMYIKTKTNDYRFVCGVYEESVTMTVSDTCYKILDNALTGKLNKITTLYCGNMLSIIGDNNFKDNKTLKYVQRSSTISRPIVSTIGENAFSGATALTEFDMYSATTIKAYAFKGCTNLYTIISGNDALQVKTLGESAFENCSSITTAPINKVTNVPKNCFKGCTNLLKITLDAKCSVDESAFENCSKLETVSGSGAIKTIGQRAFYGTNIAELIISNVTSIGIEAFAGCANLKSVSLTAVTSIGESAFNGCAKLTSVTAYGGSTANVTTLGAKAFYECKALISATFNKITTINSYTFYNCSSLTTVSATNVTSIGTYAFYGCTSLTSIGGNLSKVTTVESNAFNNCSKLDVVSFDSITTVGSYAFYNCSKLLTSVTGSKIESNIITSIGDYAFYKCNAIKTVNLNPGDGIYGSENITTIGQYAFRECSSLDRFESAGDMTFKTGVFYECRDLTNLSLGNATKIPAYLCYNCINLESLTNTIATTIGDYAFAYCSVLEVLNATNFINVTSIGNYAFAYSGVKSIFLNTKENTTLGTNCYLGCTITQLYYGAFKQATLDTSVFGCSFSKTEKVFLYLNDYVKFVGDYRYICGSGVDLNLIEDKSGYVKYIPGYIKDNDGTYSKRIDYLCAVTTIDGNGVITTSTDCRCIASNCFTGPTIQKIIIKGYFWNDEESMVINANAINNCTNLAIVDFVRTNGKVFNPFLCTNFITNSNGNETIRVNGVDSIVKIYQYRYTISENGIITIDTKNKSKVNNGQNTLSSIAGAISEGYFGYISDSTAI